MDQFGDGFAFDEFEELFGRVCLSLSLSPTGRAAIGMKNADSQPGGTIPVNTSARIAADLTRPGHTDGPEFNAFNAVFGERRFCSVGNAGQRCGCANTCGTTQKCTAVHGAFNHDSVHFWAAFKEHGSSVDGCRITIQPMIPFATLQVVSKPMPLCVSLR